MKPLDDDNFTPYPETPKEIRAKERRSLSRRTNDEIFHDQFLTLKSMVNQHAKWFEDMGVADMSTRQRGSFPVLAEKTDTQIQHNIQVERKTALYLGVSVGGTTLLVNLLFKAAEHFHWFG